MGLITSSFRVMYLTAYQFTLENKIQMISSAKMDLMTSSEEILSLGYNLDPENPAVKQMKARSERLTLLEKRLDIQMKEYQQRLQAVQAELKSCEDAMGKAIDRSFSYQL